MRGLTVRQPWAWAIVHGGKDVENRTRSLGPYRGPVAIHAGLVIDHEYDRRLIGAAVGRLARDGSETGLQVVAQFGGDERTHGNEVTERYGNRGAVIGVVDLVDVHEATPPEVEWCGCSAWAERFYVHHLVLANPRPLPRPIPWRGALGLWTVPDELEAAIREQVTQ